MKKICELLAKLPRLKHIDVRVFNEDRSRDVESEKQFFEKLSLLPKECTWRFFLPEEVYSLWGIDGPILPPRVAWKMVPGTYEYHRQLEELLQRKVPVQVETRPQFYPIPLRIGPSSW